MPRLHLLLTQILFIIPFVVHPALPSAADTHLLYRRTAGPESTEGDIQQQSPLANILHNTHRSTLYTYPTDFTRDIAPIPIHSHNDYWRTVPFYSALSVGAISIEADIWLHNETLYVGHEPAALTVGRTLDALYITPILEVLARMNPVDSPFATLEKSLSPILPSPSPSSSSASDQRSKRKNGVFDTNSTQTLYLWIDIKTDGKKAWPYLLEALKPLRQGGWLTTFYNSVSAPSADAGGGKMVEGPVTVIATGNAPLELIRRGENKNRDVFYDAPLENVGRDTTTTEEVSPFASTSYRRQFGDDVLSNEALNGTRLELLRSQVNAAHAKGVKVRYWDLPAWPIAVRDAVWAQLVAEGVDLLCVDDIFSAAAGATAAGGGGGGGGSGGHRGDRGRGWL